MIGWIEGKVLSPHMVVTAGGVGYVVRCPQPLRVGENVTLHVTTLFRQENIELYGFADPVEQECFDALVKARGVGPVAALSLLGALGVAGLAKAVVSGNTEALRKAPGVGPALAKQLLASVKLPAHIQALAAGSVEVETPVQYDPMVSAIADTLAALGFQAAAAEAAAARAYHEQPDADESAVLAAALAILRPES